ncbi:MAG TPA: hypothetical protein PKD85_21795, partial [Saprospiraceae bacterium]|nr:hypothetical protein [Saprospiraceae bacterium]
QGNWGPKLYRSGVNQKYLLYVKNQIIQSIVKSYHSKREVVIQIAQIESIPKDLIADTRPPYIFDDGLRLMKILNKEDGQVLCTIINHGNHPETAGSDNVLISSDFVHYL